MQRVVCLVALMGLGGCGLIDSDITDFNLSLPEREVTVDTADWELTDDSAMPAIDCSDEPAVCSAGIGELCGAEGVCFGSCDAEDTCKVTVAVSLFHRFDLASEQPELEQIDGQPLVSVTIDRVYYTVTENSFTQDSPELTVYVAPQTVMNPGDPLAEEIGVIASVASMQTIEEAEVELSDSGEDSLARYMKDYTTPFNLILGTTVELSAGDEIPSGRLVAVVKADAHAGL